MSIADMFKRRDRKSYVEADVDGDVNDVEAYVAAFVPKPRFTEAELQKHRRVIGRTAERDELQQDRRADRRANARDTWAAVKATLLFTVFFVLELVTLAKVFLARGLARDEAFGTACVAAATFVALIEAATTSAHRIVRALSYAGLVIGFSAVAYIRLGVFADDGGTADSTASAIVALIGAVGAGVALHAFRRRAHAAAEAQRRGRTVDREITERTREIDAAERALVTAERDARARAAAERALRLEYPRLRQIAAARRCARTAPASSPHT